MEFLTQSYKEAQEILEKAALLDEMIEADPQRVLLEMISLWNGGRISSAGKGSGR